MRRRWRLLAVIVAMTCPATVATVATAGQTERSVRGSTRSTDGFHDFPVEIEARGMRAGSTLELTFTDAVNDPVAGDGAVIDTSGATSVELFKDAIVALSRSPSDLTIEELMIHDGAQDRLSGTATVPAGVTLTIAVDHRPAVTIPNGHFIIPA